MRTDFLKEKIKKSEKKILFIYVILALVLVSVNPAAIDAYNDGKDFVYLHVEGTDECSHQGDLTGKIKCAEDIDLKVVKPIYEYLQKSGEEFRILVVPDHRTPLSIRTHTSDPVPFLIYDSRKETEADNTKQFNERAAMASGNHIEEGYTLADRFFERKN